MANGDAAPLADIWSHSAEVTTMHPIGGRQVGWDDVRGSWEQVAGVASAGEVKLVDQLIRVSGDVAYELGMEQGTITIAGQRRRLPTSASPTSTSAKAGRGRSSITTRMFRRQSWTSSKSCKPRHSRLRIIVLRAGKQGLRR